ncbi:PE-PPE domain-containing protein [Mycobacterium sp. SA01]|uniref:PE-PPE domain-containing protein n=1 Tax=Mycobacterium sp. SA01 TaxID=3238820 RepID=UPI00351BC8A2
MSSAIDRYVSPSSSRLTSMPAGPYNGVAVITPAQSAPTYGTLPVDESVAAGVLALHACITSSGCDYNQDVGSMPPSIADTFVVFGYSQSAAIAMQEKRNLAATYSLGEGPDVSFVVIGNARPNRGLAVRDTVGIVTQLLFGVPIDRQDHEPPPTDTQYATVDIALQYDGLSDAPLNPLNLFAAVNAYVGLALHIGYSDYGLGQPGVIDQGQHGDTHYYLVSTPILPLLMPLQDFGRLGHALADTLDAPLRVIVESAYDRTVSPGVPTPWNLRYFPNPVTFATNLASSIPVGLDNGIQDLIGVRPFQTTRPGPYGVGGPEVTDATPVTAGSASAAQSALRTVTVTKSTGQPARAHAKRGSRRPSAGLSTKPNPRSKRHLGSTGSSGRGRAGAVTR